MMFLTNFVVCMAIGFINGVSLNYGSHGSDISLYPVNYQLGNRYNLHDGGRPGSLQHVDVDNVYNGHDIIDDDKEDNRYNQGVKKHQGGFNVPKQDSYDGGIEDRYNKALRDVGHSNGRRNNLFDAGVRHLSDGFDFGVSKRYDNALRGSDHGASNGQTQTVGSGYSNKATGYGSGSKSSGGYGGSKTSGYGGSKTSGYSNNKSHSGYGSSKNAVGKDDGFGKSSFGNDDFNFGSSGSTYQAAPHIADINFSGIRDKSSFAHPSRNIGHSSTFGNSFGNKARQHRAVSTYPPKSNTHLNSYPAENQPYAQNGRQFKRNTGNAAQFGGNIGHATGNRDHLGNNGHFTGNNGHLTGNNGHFTGNNGHLTGNNGHFTGNNGHLTGNNGHFTGNNGHLTGNNGHFNGNNGHFNGNNGHRNRYPQHSAGYSNDHQDPYTVRRRSDGH